MDFRQPSKILTAPQRDRDPQRGLATIRPRYFIQA